MNLDDDALEFHARHLLLDEIDEAGVWRLAESTAAIVGLGGLGCPAAAQLAACGTGRIVLIDDDRIEKSNLQRQHIYREEDCGEQKTEVAAKRLAQLNPRCAYEAKNCRADAANLAGLIAEADLVLDCSDNFPTRHAINEICRKEKIDLIIGAAERFDGQVMAFQFSKAPSPCYACLYPPDGAAPAATPCAVLGVFAPLTAMIGALMAAEAVRLLAITGESGLAGRMLAYDMLDGRSRSVKITPSGNCGLCK